MNPEPSRANPAHDCAHAATLAEYLRADDLDAAIEAGLMRYVPCPACDPAWSARLVEAQRKLLSAWAARDRYRARNARLAKRAVERDAKRAAAVAEKKNALPPAVAAILARAKAKAAERGKP